jgi:two-component sensor histidine kinase
MRLKVIRFISALACVTLSSNSLSDSYISKSSISNKIPQKNIIEVLEDKHGVLWLNTLNGIYKYDGAIATHYSTNPSSKTKIGSYNIASLIEERQGGILAISKDSGIHVYSQSENSFIKDTRFIHSNKAEAEAIDATFGLEEELWIAFDNNAITKTNLNTGQQKNYILSAKSVITKIKVDHQNKIYVSDNAGKIYLFDETIDQFQLVLDFSDCDAPLAGIKDFHTREGKVFWVGPSSQGLYLHDRSLNKCKFVDLSNENIGQPSVHTIVSGESSDILLVGTDKGLFKIAYDHRSTEHFDTRNSLLTDNWVLSIDKSSLRDMYWIGTYQGLSVLINSSGEHHDSQINPELASVVAIDSSQELGLWIATLDNLVTPSDRDKDHIAIQELYENAPRIFGEISSLHVGSNNLWIGFKNQGLGLLNANLGHFHKFSTSTTPAISHNSVSSILRLQNSKILVGTYGGGLNLISFDGEYAIEIIDNGKDLNELKVITLYSDSLERTWVGSESGLYIFSQELGDYRKIKVNDASREEELSPKILDIAESPDGRLWFATLRNGLLVTTEVDPDIANSVTVKRVTFDKVYSDSPFYSVRYSRGRIWLTTDDRALFMPLDKNMGENVYVIHRNQDNKSFDAGVSHIDSNGFIYFGGSSGYSKFNSRYFEYHNSPPKLILAKILTPTGEMTTPYLGADHGSLELTHKDYFITLTFSVIDFLHPDKNQYRYKLGGFDPDWIESGNKNNATYTNLPAGRYVLRAQGADSHGNWNREGLTLTVTVLPPPWRTKWAYTAYISVALFLVWWAKKTYDTYILKEKATELAEEMHRTADRAWDHLQDQIDFQQDLLKSASNHYSSSLDIIGESVRHDLKGDTLYLESQKRINVLKAMNSCLHYKGDDLLIEMKSCVNLLTETLLPSATVPPESIITINDIQIGMLNVNLATPLVVVIHELALNALTHAFTQDSPANYLELHLEQLSENNKRYLELRLSDSGSGIRDSANTRSYFGSGLNLVSQIVNNLNGELDISCNDGTKITIKIPMT